MNRKKLLAALLAAVMLLSLCACGIQPETPADDQTVSVTDGIGREVSDHDAPYLPRTACDSKGP